MTTDRWITRAHALAGIGALGWELGVEHGKQWWVLIIVMWLMGAPLEGLIRLLTEGRIQINVKRNSNEEHKDGEDT